MIKGIFLARPNRFVAAVGGRGQRSHCSREKYRQMPSRELLTRRLCLFAEEHPPGKQPSPLLLKKAAVLGHGLTGA